MAKIEPIVQIELDPHKPVPEICAVISAVTPYHPNHESDILQGIQDAIDQRIKQLKKGDERFGKQILQPHTN